MAEKFFDKVYAPMDTSETRDFYDAWSEQYEADVGNAGYATPARASVALSKILTDKTKPILDFGCGTGLSGVALKTLGYTTIDGMDPSGDMIAKAHDKGVYRALTKIEPGTVPPDGYAAICAIGVIGCGAAPVSVFDDIMSGLDSGGLFVLSYNDHALEHPEYEGKMREYTDPGKARLVSEDYGPHLPDLGQNSMSKVYVIEKL